LAEDPALTFLRVRVAPWQSLPVTWTRDLLFVKNGFLVVKDRLRFESTMKIRVGPCYQTRNLGPQCGPNWFNTYYDQLYYTGLGLGRGVQAICNPAWDTLLYFTPQAERRQVVTDRYSENPYRNSPLSMRQVWSGMARPGQELAFTTVLLPHRPTFTPKDLLDPPPESQEPKRIEVAVDQNQLTVLKVVTDDPSPTSKARHETWVMLNDTGKPAAGGPLESDALVALVAQDRNGSVHQRVMLGGSALKYLGNDETAKSRQGRAAAPVLPRELLK
jgi:hypothetical protein